MVSKGFADPTVVLSKWVEEIKISGDLRLRGEDFHKTTPGQVDRSRQRYRLRVNTDFKLPKNFFVKTTVASGTGEQVSTNQSFDNLSSQKSIWIDKVYAGWVPCEFLTLQAGRMENPIWRQYSSDVVWDGDFNPEGFSESVNALVGPFNVFATALQMVVDEDSGNNQGTATAGSQKDQWMLGEQVGVEFRLPLESRMRLAYANYNWINERMGDFSAVAFNEGNRRAFPSSGTLSNNFYVNEYTGALSSWVLGKPVVLQGTYIRNDQAREDALMQPKENTGYQWGVIFGRAKEAKTWEVAYFNKHVRTDATVADVSDSDFGDGGTNREGHIMWLAYAPYEWMVLSLKHSNTQVINPALSPNRDDIRRTQLDWTMKF